MPFKLLISLRSLSSRSCESMILLSWRITLGLEVYLIMPHSYGKNSMLFCCNSGSVVSRDKINFPFFSVNKTSSESCLGSLFFASCRMLTLFCGVAFGSFKIIDTVSDSGMHISLQTSISMCAVSFIFLPLKSSEIFIFCSSLTVL